MSYLKGPSQLKVDLKMTVIQNIKEPLCFRIKLRVVVSVITENVVDGGAPHGNVEFL